MFAVFHPTDLTEKSELAFCHALKLALLGETRLTILHTDAPGEPHTPWHAFPSVRSLLHRWELLEPGAKKTDVAKELGLEVEKVELLGSDPVETMLSYLDRHPVDLIVLATHGRDGLPRFLRGSVAEPLARRAGTMALFVPHGATGFVHPGDGVANLPHVIVPVDHKPNPRFALRAANAIVSAIGVESTIEMVNVGGGLTELDGAEVTQLSGNVVDAILEVATERRAGLIVMSTEGHHGVLDALRGSTTEQVLRGAPCPVLAVPAVGNDE